MFNVYAFEVVLLELVTGQKPLEVNRTDEELRMSLTKVSGNMAMMAKICSSLKSLAIA